MKTCPFCQVENRDDATTCRFCGRELNPPPATWNVAPQEESPDPTQPVYPAGRGQTGQRLTQPPTPPPGGLRSPDVDQTQPPYPTGGYGTGSPPPGYGQPGAPGYPPAQGGYNPQGYGATQAGRPAGGPGYNTPGAGSQGSGAQSYGAPRYGAAGAPPYGPPGAQVYTQPEPARRRTDRPWLILLGVLAVLLLCMGGLAVWIFTATAAGGVGRAGADLATQAAGLFGGAAAENTPFPTATLLAPSPWPTFTPEPSTTPAPSQTPEPTSEQPATDATQVGGLERYLTDECAAALDTLEGLSKAVTTNPALPLEAAWREQLSQSVKTVREQCGSLDQASPVPGLMGEAQQNLDQATQEFDEANRLFKEGVDELNPAKMLDAGKHLAQATGFLNEALKALGRIGD